MDASREQRDVRSQARVILVRRVWSTTAVLALLVGPGVTDGAQGQEPSGPGRIEGQVTDRESGNPLEGVDVILGGSRLAATTGRDGRFVIDGLRPGEYDVRVELIGYGAALIDEIRVRPGEATALDFALDVAPVTLPSLAVTSGMMAHERLAASVEDRTEASLAETTVSAATAQNFNAANAYDVLRIVPGVSYLWENAGGRGGQPTRIRGASTWSVATVVEDFPGLRTWNGVEDGGLGSGLGASIPAIAIQDVTIKKGSLGVLYSGDVEGGVIVNHLKHGRPGRPTGSLWLEANPIAEQLVMAELGGGSTTVDYYVAGKVLNGSYDELNDFAGRPILDDDVYSGLVRLGFNWGEALRVEFLGLRGENRTLRSQPGEDLTETPDVDESRLTYEVASEKEHEFYGASLDHSIGEATSYEIGYSYNRQRGLVIPEEGRQQGVALRDLPTRTHNLFGNVYLARPLSAGIDYSAKLGFESIWNRQREREKTQRFEDRSAFYTNTLSFGRSLFLNAGARYVDASDEWRDHNMWLYNAGVSYVLPAMGTTARISYSTGYTRNAGFAFFFGPISEAGGVELTENRTLEAGLDQPLSFGGYRGKLSVTVYRTRSDGVPTFSGWGDNVVYYEQRDARGIEIAADQSLGRRVGAFASFAFTDTEIVGTTHPAGIQVGNTAVPVPRYTGALALQLEPVERLHISAIGTYDDGMRTEQIDDQTGDVLIVHNTSFTRLNLAAAYEIRDWITARLRAENVLDDNDLGFSADRFGADGHEFEPGVARDPGRFVSAGVSFRF